MEITIVYQDQALVVCIKPAGILSEEGGMPALLRAQTGAAEMSCVHRLDRDAAGLMVYAKSRAAAAALSAQIAGGRLGKEYLAVVPGTPEPEAELCDLLYRDAARNKSYVVKRMRKGVREARLRYRVIRQAEGLSLLRIALFTGRSHQIRVQLASRGMPLVGDRKYGSAFREGGLALWSAALAFVHPVTGEALRFEAPPPRTWPWTLFPE